MDHRHTSGQSPKLIVYFFFLSGLNFTITVNDTARASPSRMWKKYKIRDRPESTKRSAVAQIHERRYYERYQIKKKQIILVGVSFSKEKRKKKHKPVDC